MRIAHASLWVFVPVCFLASTIGFLVFGMGAAAITDAAIIPGVLVGIVAPPVFLIWKRRQKIDLSLPAAPSLAIEPDVLVEKKMDPQVIFWIKWLGIPLAIISGILVFHQITSDNLGLQVVRKDYLSNDGLALIFTNIGSAPINVLQVSINDRAECTVGKPVGLFVREKVLASEILQVGDVLTLVSNCRVIRAEIKTDRGTGRFSFNDREN
jgi:hypothetical protein